MSSGIYRNFNKGEILVDGERECMGLVLVLDGQIRAYTQSEDGKEITLFRLLGGDSCALSSSCMMKDITFTVNLVAEQKTKGLQCSFPYLRTIKQQIYCRKKLHHEYYEFKIQRLHAGL